MNVRAAIESIAKHNVPGLAGKVYVETVRSLVALAPSKPFDKETARSMLAMNDVGGLVSGDTDMEADVAWLTRDVVRALWNTCARLVRNGGAK